ncbi:MAG: HEPN domain-containing protein [Rhizobiaceae bacterium]
MKISDLFQKAERAIQPAKVLLSVGDTDGACSRAYYAMFDTARAALLAAKSPVHSETARTHSGLISAFGLHLVKSGEVSAELGRSFNRVHQIRLIADYKGDPVEMDIAIEVVRDAALFVETLEKQYLEKP